MKTVTRVVAMGLVCWATVVTSQSAAGDEIPTALYKKLAASTARVINGGSSGTAWVVDREKRLLITNFHVVAVRTSGKKVRFKSVASHVTLIFPQFSSGNVDQNPGRYRDMKKHIRAEVIGSSMVKDLALLKADALPPNAETLELSWVPPKPGSRVHSVGHPGGSAGLWVYSQGSVRAIARTEYEDEFGKTNFSSVETQSPINQGDSGGAMVNDDGKVVAVVQSHANGVRLISTSIAAWEVRQFLSTYRANATSPQTASNHYSRAAVLYDREQYSSAIRELDAAIGLQANKAKYRYFRGQVRLRLGHYDSALRDVENGLAIRRQKPKKITGERESERLAHQLDQLLYDLHGDSPMDADFGYAVLGEIFARRAEKTGSANDWRLSIDAYDKAIRYGRKTSTIYYNRGYAKEKLSRYTSAIKDYRQAIRIGGPASPITEDAKAQALWLESKLRRR